ncbi:hypothetical protein TNCV_5013711 [Trichonephila clavipes]|nr:hypothetical protein TNCV_5013711 [Trichonephila clavipes]
MSLETAWCRKLLQKFPKPTWESSSSEMFRNGLEAEQLSNLEADMALGREEGLTSVSRNRNCRTIKTFSPQAGRI